MGILIFIILFSLSFSKETYYCVQLASSTKAKDLEKLFSRVKDLPKVRVERIQKWYTLRIGFYKDKERAIELLKEVKRRNFKDAFLRTCYYIPSRIMASNFLKRDFRGQKAEEEFYKLLVQSLLGGGKLKLALKAVKKALRHFPESPYWWKLYGDILLWNSKPHEALEAYLKAYRLSPSRDLAKKIFELALKLRRFNIAREFLDKVNVPPKVKIYVYESSGDLEGLIKYLENLKTDEALIYLARLKFSLGEKEEALKVLDLHDKLYGVSSKSVLLRANILFSERQFTKALELLKANYERFKDNPEFLRTLSDLAWMLGDYGTAWKASERLIKLGKAEYIDYERVNYKYATSNPEKAVRLSLEAYEKFKKRYFLEFAFSTAFGKGLFKEVVKIFEKYRGILSKNPYTFIAYITALDKLGKSSRALKLTESYLKKSFNKEVLKFYVYLLIEKRRIRKLKEILRKYAKFEKDKELALIFAYAYVVLQDGKKALALYRYSTKKDPTLYSDILYLLGKTEEAKHYRFKNFVNLKKRLEENPELIKNPEFLRNYLSLGMEFMSPAEFEKLLFVSKKVLSRSLWRDLYISYLMSKGQKIRAVWLARIYKYPLKPWVWLSVALEEKDRVLIQKILREYGESLPVRDRVEALKALWNPFEAFYYAFLGLENNPYDSYLQRQIRELATQWGNRYELKGGYYSRKGIRELRSSYKIRKRIGERGKFLTFHLFYGKLVEKKSLRKVPERKEFKVGFEKVFPRGILGVEAGVTKGLRDNFSFSLFLSYKARKKLFTELELSKNKRSEETTYLYLGGMKDSVKVSLVYSLTSRFFGHVSGEYATFRSQDEEVLGWGVNLFGELSYKLRAGYPDYTFSIYVNRGSYKEKNSKGVLREIALYRKFKALPESFTSFGAGFSFGSEVLHSFTRSWKPFMSFFLGYNTQLRGMFFESRVGFGGMLLGRDTLGLEIVYSENRGGVKERVFNLNILYRRLY